MAEIYNTNSNTLLSGTSGNDIIQNGGWWYENGVNTRHDHGSNVIINTSDGNDYVENWGSSVTINTGNGNNYVYNGGNSLTIINTGAGNDSVYNVGDSVKMNTGAGNDFVYNYYGSLITIIGGKGNDSIYNDWDFDNNSQSNHYSYGYGENVLFKYSSGDGNDIIYGFKADSTLSISGSSYSSTKSGDDIIFTVGDGKISLIGAASLSKINVKGTKASTTPIENNSWKLSGSTATYGTSSNTLVTITGVKSTKGLSISGKVVTVAASALNQKKITVSDGYTLALANDVPTPTAKNATWTYKNGVATYKSAATTAGYTLASNSKTITYSKAKTASNLTTISGLKAATGLKVSGNVVTVSNSALNKSKVTISNGYTLALANDVPISTAKNASWTYKNGVATYKSSATTAGYTLASNSKTITYSKAKTASILTTISGIKAATGLKVSGNVVTVSNSALNKAKVTISNGYKLALASDAAKISTNKAWSLKNSTATYNQTTTAGYKLASDAKSISYSKKTTKTLATINGAKKSSGFTIKNKTIKVAAASISKKVTVSGNYAFEFASGYKNAQITGSTANDTIKILGSDVTISGGKGNDSLIGSSGADFFVYNNGDGNDIITNFGENDVLSIKSGAANVSTSGNDVIFTVGSGKITLKNANGKKITYFDASGNENTYPSENSDVEYTSDGKKAVLKDIYSKETFIPSDYSNYASTLVTIDAAAVEQPLKITGNNKKNRIMGTEDNDLINGGVGGDTIEGGAGNDELYGDVGNDSLIGGAGDDSLWGGADSDTLTGGEGRDIFYYDDGDGNDTITDYKSGVDKVIILSPSVNIGNPIADRAGNVTFTVGSGQITFQNAANKSIQLLNVGGTALMNYNPH